MTKSQNNRKQEPTPKDSPVRHSKKLKKSPKATATSNDYQQIAAEAKVKVSKAVIKPSLVADKDQGQVEQDYLNFEAVRSRHFYEYQKETRLAVNQKLREFYDKQKEESEVSVFTLAENAIQIGHTMPESNGNPSLRQKTLMDANPLFKRIIE